MIEIDATKKAAIDAAAARPNTFKADAGRAALVAKLKTATPAQIDTYFATRTTVAQLKADIVDIVKVLALEIRD